MTLAESGANILIGQFGETIRVYQQDGQVPENPDNPVFFETDENESQYTEHKVRLYTTISEEMMQDYGLDEDTESMFYTTDDIADEGDTIEYPPNNTTWNVRNKHTNQIGQGPYIFVYSLGGLSG